MKPERQRDSNSQIYYSSITAGSLLLHESKTAANLLLSGLSPKDVKKKVIKENLFQRRSPVSSERHCRLILERLTSLDPGILQMIIEADRRLAIQALLACAIKSSRLLGDFMLNVIGERMMFVEEKLAKKDWQKFIEQCEQVDPHITEFTEFTRNKLRQIIFRILVEAGYIESQKSPKLTPVSIEPQLRLFLAKHKEKYVLTCLEVYK